jgi:probable F420-dependent oxidoreductase
MKLGLVFPTRRIGAEPATIAAYARAAEDAGYGFLATYDHVIGADRSARPGWRGFYDIDDEFHEPFVLFGFLAALCSLELSTCVLVLPQRQTVLVAKQAAQVDILSGGRLKLGVGVGWNDVEYDALGLPFEARGARFEGQIALLRELWTRRRVDHEIVGAPSERVVAAGLAPLPVQQPIPLWLGGSTERAWRRVGRLADGYLPPPGVHPGNGLDIAMRAIRTAAEDAGRDPDAIGLEGIVPVRDGDPAGLRSKLSRWRDAGADGVALSVDSPALLGTANIDVIRRLADEARPTLDAAGS